MMLVLKKPYGLRRAPAPSLTSGMRPSRFGTAIGNKRVGATAAMTGGVAWGVGGSVFAATSAVDLALSATVSAIGTTVRTVSYSADEMIPFSLSSTAKRSLCS